MARTRPWEVSNELWEQVRPLLPERPPHPEGGRPSAPYEAFLKLACALICFQQCDRLSVFG